ncbi:DUF2919 family protein [Vibrio lentus]|nr:DUF2919 family protein [Vibrio lentus]
MVRLVVLRKASSFSLPCASRESERHLEIIYPDHQMFCVGIALSVPSLLMMRLLTRTPEKASNKVVSWGR